MTSVQTMLQSPDLSNLELHVNDGPLAPSDVTLLWQSRAHEPLEELRHSYHSEGYLFIKGLLPQADVLKAWEQYFSMIEPSGILKPGSNAVDGIFDPEKDKADFPGIGANAASASSRPGGGTNSASFVDLALSAHYAPWWYADGLCKHPTLPAFVKQLTGWGEDTLPLQRTLLRSNIPGNRANGVHYDQIFLRHGEPTAVTTWVPIEDVSLEGGGLIYLEFGDKLGQQFEDDFANEAAVAGLTEEECKNAFNRNMMTTAFLADGPAGLARQNNSLWLLTAYEAGDVVFHKLHMIHASTINQVPENWIRLGTDLRFVNAPRPYDSRWCKPYTFEDGI